MESPLPALVVVVPLLAALLVALAGRWWRGLAWGATVLSLAASCAGAVGMLLHVARGGETIRHAFGGWIAPTGIEYEVDRLNGMVLAMVAAASLLTALWMRPGLRREIREAARNSYYVVLLLFATGLMGITITADVFNLYVFLEIASITAYVLVAMGRRRQALYAGYTYLVVGSIGAIFILLGIGHLYMATGSLGMRDIAALLEQHALYDASHVRTAFAFLTVGLAIKMALFPLHGWQPGAYTYAPSSASLLLAATSTKVAAYAFYRITFTVFGKGFLVVHLPEVRSGVEVMAAAAIVIGPLLALRQGDLKRLLAYSSVGQIGYVMLGVVLLNESGVTGSLIHFWNHAAAKAALFCVAGALVYATGASQVDDLSGLGRRAPWTATVLTIAGCSMVGVPLTAGFLSKYHLAVGALEGGRWFLVPVLLLSSLLTAAYVWRLVQRAWFAPSDVEAPVGEEVPWAMRGAALVLALACLALGATPVAVDVAGDAARAILAGGGP